MLTFFRLAFMTYASAYILMLAFRTPDNPCQTRRPEAGGLRLHTQLRD